VTPAPARLPLVLGLVRAVAVIILAIMTVSNTVLAHDIYSNLRDRDGKLCCNGQDCKPVEATVLPDGNYYLPTTDEVIPAELATPSPDDRFHHCVDSAIFPLGFDRGAPVWGAARTRCFFAPMNSS
jgi:hypothetical protein